MKLPESTVDVLIIGAGPAGLMAAAWMAQCGINTRIVEERKDGLQVGRADGLHTRSMEIFESFGFDQEVTKLWDPITDDAVWSRDADGSFYRSEREMRPLPLRARWTGGLLQQAIIEDIIKRHIKLIAPIEVEYETVPTSLSINENDVSEPDHHPCVVTLRRKSTSIEGNYVSSESEETVRAKYVIGADGGKSWTRKQLGFTMEGNRTDSIWGVIDLVVTSDFPDIRTATTVKNNEGGNLFLFRRERGMTRFYVQLNKGKDEEILRRESVTQETITEKIKFMLRPYTVNVKRCEWWSAYTVAQHLSTGMSKHGRAFLVGDAVHTHSPLVGQGMNISMQDSYNLGWKLAGVIHKRYKPSILATFDLERRPVAEQLVEVDQVYLKLFDAPKGQEPDWLLERAAQMEPFLMGLSVHYDNSPLTAWSPKTIPLDPQADHIIPGKRFPEITVSNHATAKIYPLQQLLRSNGRFHVIVFAADISDPCHLERMNVVGARLASVEQEFKHELDIFAVHCASRSKVELASMHETFFPEDEDTGRDYDRVYCIVDMAFADLGISSNGTIIAVRPDQYVGWLGGLGDMDKLSQYFEDIFDAK
ncbi:hypothetical protein N7448_003830 [Penicillium atrosanguineum]|uniref:FAD binding domain-containing protein n=1 Tax=Penicillium atrosanguineum TaxID=1132637 RepID=A0A9W9H818_9EURO|nr:uncharacterized protein N7443_002798 [Penicillium atrosanguineum]KAJ5140422.1 hypothetical protein N7448_003830 [Penicillium atrosanguineum]KAJ5310337.1 hypothetical protein N7443_002798 [Penicillium atrosanguineum]KAJ5315855.1 hypothetical protein N7476_006162 [Penicillium atrosanguineum]